MVPGNSTSCRSGLTTARRSISIRYVRRGRFGAFPSRAARREKWPLGPGVDSGRQLWILEGVRLSIQRWSADSCSIRGYVISKAGRKRRCRSPCSACDSRATAVGSPERPGRAKSSCATFLSTAAGRSRPELVRVIALAWLLAASASTAIALVQYFGSAEPFTGWISASAVGEAYANLRQRNQFASLTVIGMASLFLLAPREMGEIRAHRQVIDAPQVELIAAEGEVVVAEKADK